MRHGFWGLLAFMASAPGGVAASSPETARSLDRLPLLFEENRGQSGPAVRFVARGTGYLLFLTEREAVLRVSGSQDAVVRMRFEGAARRPRLEGAGKAPPVQYLSGRSRMRVQGFSQARYRDLWPGIDLVFHGTRDALEYDLELKPGARPEQIRLAFSGASRLSQDRAGDLALETGRGPVRWKKPVLYQDSGGSRTRIDGRYRVLGATRVGFAVASYDASKPLVIDPVLSLASYHAGNGQDSIHAMAVDTAGAVYLAGVTNADLRFPDGSGIVPRQTRKTGNDAFVTKLDADGRTIEWWTYYGGSGDESADAVAVDASHQVYLAGATTSTNLPLNQAVQGAKAAGTDAYVAKLDATGSQVLMATYLGGDGAESVGGLGVDAFQYVYVAGQTASANFPATSNAYQSQRKGDSDGFLAVLDSAGAGLPPILSTGTEGYVTIPTGRLMYASYFGGDAGDAIHGLALDAGAPNSADGRRVPLIYLAGETASATGFPLSQSGYQRIHRGGRDGFVTAFRWNERVAAAQVLYSTYLGSAGDDAARGVSVQPGSGNLPSLRRGLVYVTGSTGGTGFPAYSAYATIDTPLPASYGTPGDEGGDAFVSVLDTNASGLSSLLFSIYLGGGSPDLGRHIAVSPQNGLAYVTGDTGPPTGKAFPLTADAYQTAGRGNGDAFFAVLDPFSSRPPGLLYSTRYGGSGVEQGRALALDGAGNAYLAGGTTSRDLPVADARQAQAPGSNTGAGFYARFRMGCTFTIVNAANTLNSAEAGAGSFQVTPSDATCTWQASTTASWLSVTQGGAPATGPGAVSYSVDANTALGSPARVGTINVRGSTPFDVVAAHTVNQPSAPADGCGYFSLASPASFSAAGGGGTLTVSTAPQCTAGALNGAVANVTWIVLGTSNATAGARGFTVAPNAGAARVGTITIGGQALIITQEGSAPVGALAGLRFVPVTPCRVMDTREGGLGAGFGAPYFNAGETRSVFIPQGRCGIPSSARAYSLNVTVAPLEPLAYLTMHPTGQPRPLVSTLNSFEGRVVANSAIVPAGTQGGVDILATNFTHVILDINGYFTEDPAQLVYYPVTPCRLADTRDGQGFPGAFGPPFLTANSVRTLPVTSGRCGIPANARAYALNFTVVPRGPLSYLTAWPAGVPQPGVSTLNSFEGRVLANAAIVPAGTNGAVNVFVTDATDAIVDIGGYFAPDDGTGLGFVTLAPCRVADTRQGEGFTGTLGPPALGAGQTRTFQFATSRCSVPGFAQAFSVNVTALPLTGRLDFLTLFPAGGTPPLVSTLNSFDGRVVANSALVRSGLNGDVNVFVPNASQVVIDINGFFGR